MIKDLRGRCGAVKVAECDGEIILDAEAMCVCPGEKHT